MVDKVLAVFWTEGKEVMIATGETRYLARKKLLDSGRVRSSEIDVKDIDLVDITPDENGQWSATLNGYA